MKELESMTIMEKKQLKWIMLIGMFPMVGLLVLTFYFYYIMVWIMIILFFIMAAHSIMSLAMFTMYRNNWLPLWVYPLNKCGIKNVDYRGICLFAVGLGIATAWIVNRHNMAGQILQNIIGIFLCTSLSVSVGKSLVVSKNFKALVVCMAMVLVYDVVMVFTPVIKRNSSSADQLDAFMKNDSIARYKRSSGESIMEIVATGGIGDSVETIPMMFKISFAMDNSSTVQCLNLTPQFILGFGDVILPSLFIVYIVTYAVITTKSVILYSLASLFCYIVGLIITDMVLMVTGRGQPALLYLLPCTVIPIMLLTVIKKDFVALWNDSWYTNQANVLVDGTAVQMMPSEPDGENKVLL